jgi:hypothetical protein
MALIVRDGNGEIKYIRADGDGTFANPYLSISKVVEMPPLTINFPATQTIAGIVSISNFPSVFPVSGTVNIGNLPSNQAVTVGNFPTTQDVTGQVSITNFPATQSVTVGNFPTTQDVTGSIEISGLPPLPQGNNAIGLVEVSNLNATQCDTATPFSPTVTNAASKIVSANANRKGLTIYNPLPESVYIDFFDSVSTSSFQFALPKKGFYEMPTTVIYTGDIWAIAANTGGDIHIRELS